MTDLTLIGLKRSRRGRASICLDSPAVKRVRSSGRRGLVPSSPASCDSADVLLVLCGRFAYTVATVLLSALVRQLKLHRLEDTPMEVRSELVSTPRDETWITFSQRN